MRARGRVIVSLGPRCRRSRHPAGYARACVIFGGRGGKSAGAMFLDFSDFMALGRAFRDARAVGIGYF